MATLKNHKFNTKNMAGITLNNLTVIFATIIRDKN